MKMGTNEKIQTINPVGEIYICPACQYTDGFHVAFKVKDDTHTAEIILICPNCHRRFQIGLNVILEH